MGQERVRVIAKSSSVLDVALVVVMNIFSITNLRAGRIILLFVLTFIVQYLLKAGKKAGGLSVLRRVHFTSPHAQAQRSAGVDFTATGVRGRQAGGVMVEEI